MDLCTLERCFGWGGLFTVCRQEDSSSMGWWLVGNEKRPVRRIDQWVAGRL